MKLLTPFTLMFLLFSHLSGCTYLKVQTDAYTGLLPEVVQLKTIAAEQNKSFTNIAGTNIELIDKSQQQLANRTQFVAKCTVYRAQLQQLQSAMNLEAEKARESTNHKELKEIVKAMTTISEDGNTLLAEYRDAYLKATAQSIAPSGEKHSLNLSLKGEDNTPSFTFTPADLLNEANGATILKAPEKDWGYRVNLTENTGYFGNSEFVIVRENAETYSIKSQAFDPTHFVRAIPDVTLATLKTVAQIKGIPGGVLPDPSQEDMETAKSRIELKAQTNYLKKNLTRKKEAKLQFVQSLIALSSFDDKKDTDTQEVSPTTISSTKKKLKGIVEKALRDLK